MLTFLTSAAAIAFLFSLLVWIELRPLKTIDGYENLELIEVIFQKTKAYTSDAVWPAMAGVSTVLDFGGGCGIHYKQANSPSVRWAVVETPAMAERAKEFATDRLKFFSDITEAAEWLGPIDVMHSNGALQYTVDPEATLRQLCSLKARRMLWQRLVLSKGGIEREFQTSLLRDNGPGFLKVSKKLVRYEITKLPEPVFLGAHRDFSLVERAEDSFVFEHHAPLVSIHP